MRAVPEWVGRAADTPIPARVKLRIVERQNGFCSGCVGAFGPKRKPQFDHVIALTNGGANRESNIQALCGSCHILKTPFDVAEKATVARIKKKTLGLTKAKRHFPKPDPKKWRKIGFGQYERIRVT